MQPDGISLSCPLFVDARLLSSIFIPTKIDTIMVEIDGVENPSRNGFNFSFYKKFEGILKYDIYFMFNQFYDHVVFPKSFMSFLVMLIPKGDSLF